MDIGEWSAIVWATIFFVMAVVVDKMHTSICKNNIGTYRMQRFINILSHVYYFIAVMCIGWALGDVIKGVLSWHSMVYF
jgi:hypothetical protein